MEIRGNLALNDNSLLDFKVDPQTGSFPTAVEGRIVYRTDLSNLFVCVQATPAPIWYPLASPSAMYVHTQTFGDNVWDINHSLGSSDAFVQVYDLNGYQIIPGEIHIIDDDNIQITFDNNIVTGKAIIAVLSEGDAQINLKDIGDVSLGTPLSGESIIYNEGTANWVAGGFSGMLPIHSETSTYSALPGDTINADTSSGAFTITLPSSPKSGARVMIYDETGSFATNNLTVIPSSGEKIRNVIDDSIILDMDHLVSEFIYLGSTVGWTYRLDL